MLQSEVQMPSLEVSVHSWYKHFAALIRGRATPYNSRAADTPIAHLSLRRCWGIQLNVHCHHLCAADRREARGKPSQALSGPRVLCVVSRRANNTGCKCTEKQKLRVCLLSNFSVWFNKFIFYTFQRLISRCHWEKCQATFKLALLFLNILLAYKVN